MPGHKPHNNNNPQQGQKRQKKNKSKAPIITREQEERERASCRSRIKDEFQIFSKLNNYSALKKLHTKSEPKLVKIDANYASSNFTKKTTDTQQQQTSQQTNLTSATVDFLRPFASLPISTRTKRALAENGFKQCTRVQHATLSSTLAKNDLFALSGTGSGKTLAFIIPVLENLWQQHWTPALGLGALIIEPTRELALQTFHTLRRIGHYHEFSAGLLIGGASFEQERASIAGMNILVATPGRLLHHLEQSSGLDLTNIVSFVIDECDHLLDIGFEEQFEQIRPLLPTTNKFSKDKEKSHQDDTGYHCMLFSATSNKFVEKLAAKILSPKLHRVSLIDYALPTTTIEHRFLKVNESEKLQTIFEFLRVHCSNKTIVFAATARQASFLYEIFRALNVKQPVHRLHSKLGADSRLQEYHKFQQQEFGVLICTDIAARGLDFTNVSWVVHYDCPTSFAQYTHRSGRTARLKGKGTNLLLVTPTQERFAHILHLQHPELQLRQVGLPQFKSDFFVKLDAYYTQHSDIKRFAEKAIISYIQHIIHEGTNFFQLALANCKKKNALFITNLAKKLNIIDAIAFLEKDKSELGLDAIKRQQESAYALKELGQETSELYLRVLAECFNIRSYDIIGLCRGYGLHSVPVLIHTTLEEHLAEKAEKEQENKKGSKSTKNNNEPEDDIIDHDLAVINRINAELETFLKEQLLLQSKGKVKVNEFQFEPSTTQPKQAPSYIRNGIHMYDDEFGCSLLTGGDDNDEDVTTTAEERAKALQFDPIDTKFNQLKQRYLEIDSQDKQYVKDVAVKKRRMKQNAILLQKLRSMGYNLTLDEVEDFVQAKKHGGEFDLTNYRKDDNDFDDEDDENQFDDDDMMKMGLGDSDNEDDENQFGHFDERYDVSKFHQIGETDDDEDDEDNEAIAMSDDDSDVESKSTGKTKPTTTNTKQQQQQSKSKVQFNLLNESSDDDDDNDSDDDYKQQQKSLSQLKQSTTPKQLNTTTPSTSNLMGLDSDNSDNDNDDDIASFASRVQKPQQNETKSQQQEEKPKKVVLTAEERRQQRHIKNEAAKAVRLQKEAANFARKRIDLNESSSDDDDDDDKTTAQQNKPVKKFLNLDESSDDDDSDDDSDNTPAPAVVVNKNGKRIAPTQIAPKAATAPKKPNQPEQSKQQQSQKPQKLVKVTKQGGK